MSDVDLKNLYNMMVDTLLLASPDMDITKEQLKDCLHELEGDAYTFLHPINLQKLFDANLLNQFQVTEIEDIRNRIFAIPPNLWTIENFEKNDRWMAVRERGKDILTALRSSATSA